MKEFIDKLISRLEEVKEKHQPTINGKTTMRDLEVYKMTIGYAKEIVNQLAEEYKEECKLDCDKLLFAYSDLLRRFQNAEETVICEFSGNISKETEELEEECEELLSQFKEILYSANTPQKSAAEYKVSEMPTGWISVSEGLPKYTDEYNVTVDVASEFGCYRTVKTLRFERIEGKEPKWVIPQDEVYRVIAWCELPAPYTEGE